jgi:hypothetical protein
MNQLEFEVELKRLEKQGIYNLREDAGPVEVAEVLGLSDHSLVCRWPRVPLKYVTKLCKKYGAEPKRYRPDLFAIADLLKRLTK